MPKVKISEYSATANSNTDVASINIDEGCAPSGINNAIRAVMGHLKDFQQGTNGDPFNGPHNGTVGATTPSTAAVTTLEASTSVRSGTTGASLLIRPVSATPSDGMEIINTFFTGSQGPLRFNDGTTTRMTLNASGDLGIGTTTPNLGGLTRALTLNTLTAGNYSGVELAGAGTLSARFITNNTGTYFGSQLSIPLVFETNATERARFNSTGAFVLAGGTTTANGIGITFPATQSASSDANTLDDYEEGTFTPEFTSTGLTVSYGQQRAIYTKIGRSVIASIYMNVSGTSGTTTNLLKITGLPFASVSTEYGFSAVFGVSQFSTYIPSAFMQSSVSEILVYRQNTVTSMTGAELANGFYLLTITYFTA